MANIVISEEAARDLRVQSRPLLVFLPNHFKPLKIAVSDHIKFYAKYFQTVKTLNNFCSSDVVNNDDTPLKNNSKRENTATTNLPK